MMVALWPAIAMGVSDEQVGRAIDAMKQYLYSQQAPNGNWDRGVKESQRTGGTALVVFALLSAGESEHHPNVAKALRYLAANSSDGTYAVGLRAHVWARLPQTYQTLLQNEAQWLQDAHRNSLFDYGPQRQTRVDHSVTQYGVLGLWEYVKRGGSIDPRFWRMSIEHFLAAQNPDGGWAYSATGRSTGSMTTAGLTMLYVARQQAMRDRGAPMPEIAHAIQRGLAWLDERFDGGQNPNGASNYYYLYGIERVALASGIRTLNGRDWFQEGARYIFDNQRDDGSIGDDVINTAFALGFLARGRVPVWVNKLMIPDARWNNRPDDIYFLTQYLSDEFQRELNWQLASLDEPAEDWRNAPVAYLSTNQRIDLTESQKRHLKRYIDLGGTIMLNCEGGSQAVAVSFTELMEELYPQSYRRRLEPDDIFYRMHHRLEPRTSPVVAAVSTISNGARDVAYIFESDVGLPMQRDNPPGRNAAWQLVTNFFVLATDRRTLDNRLIAAHEPRRAGRAAHSVTIGRAQYDGAWNPEPVAYELLGDHLFNRASIDLQVEPIALSELGESTLGLTVVSGVNDVTLTEEQLSAIDTYIRGGGTLFIETVGGQGNFARSIEGQLARHLQSTAMRLDDRHPIVTGEGIERGYDNREVTYTRFTITQLNVGTRPRLTAFYIDGRPAVILCAEDMSLALLNLRHWGIFGYSPQSARQLLSNLILATQKEQ